MRLQNPTASFLALLLCACGGPAANETTAAADGNAPAAGPAGGGTGATPQQQQPGNRSPAPQPSDEVTLTASPQQVTEGSTVTLTLRNGADRQVGYNLCTSSLETAAGRPVPTSRVCTMELRTLEAGRTATYPYELPVNMVEGSYRFLAQAELIGSGRRLAIRSNSFEVRSD